MSSESDTVDPDAIQKAWNALKDKPKIYRDVRDSIIDSVTDICSEQINGGNYDAAAPLTRVFQEFKDEHLTEGKRFREEVLNSGELVVVKFDLGADGEEKLAHTIFDRLIEDLVETDELLYVHHRQQVRSHVAEMARYFALIRQRITADTDYSFTPNLVKMVKLASAPREQPIMGRSEEKASRFQAPLREITESINDDDFSPAWELSAAARNQWKSAVEETIEVLSNFFEDDLPEDFDSFAAYQARALRDIYLDGISEGNTDRSNVVTASTGGGKTEAFLFPTLAYAITANKAGIEGNKAVLTYPRRDLCNNQFERTFSYITDLNKRLGELEASFDAAPLTLSIQHGGRGDVTLPCPYCDGELSPAEGYQNTHFVCSESERHEIRYASTGRKKAADLIITTQSSLHRRLMDHYGNDALWEQSYPTKFLVLDEVHIYTDQAGMNVANVVRRFKQAVNYRAPEQSPSLVASSATIENAEEFTKRIFDTRTARRIQPADDEKTELSREHFIFVKATDPRDVQIPIGKSAYKPREEWTDVQPTTATNLSCMIQIAFAFYHTMRKERAGSRPGLDENKDRILGFVDSIDSVSRLGGYVQEAEENGLFKLRFPDAILDKRGNNPDCPRKTFQGETDDKYDETAVCESVVPNPNINPCPVYEDGECWWTMRDEGLDLQEMTVGIHKSGRTQHAGRDQELGDTWDQLISTSALEVGFDHSSIIGTFQYRSPRNIPGFLQRKGRGGRDIEDEPINVVVFGSTPTDSYYFHHSDFLSNPRDEHLQIPLDENNRFVRAEHMTAAVMDYFNVIDEVDAQRLFSGKRRDPGPGPDIDYLRDQFEKHHPAIRNWLTEAFDVEEAEANRAIEHFDEYVLSLYDDVGDGTSTYWEFFESAIETGGPAGAYDRIDELMTGLRGEQ